MQKDTIAPQIGELTFEKYVKLKVDEQRIPPLYPVLSDKTRMNNFT